MWGFRGYGVVNGGLVVISVSMTGLMSISSFKGLAPIWHAQAAMAKAIATNFML